MTSVFSFCYGQVDTLPTSLSCQIIVEGTNLTLAGQPKNVMATRVDILNLYPTKTQLHLKIQDHDCSKLRNECEKIGRSTQTVISITEPTPQSSFASQNSINISINGTIDNAELARVQVLVLLDKLSQLAVDTAAIPYKLHHLICGRKRIGLESILATATGTNIYLPSPFIFNDVNPDYSPLIYITGESNGVARVKESLAKIASQKAQSMYYKDAVLHPRKLDWMLLHCRDDLRKMMRDNGSFISFPKMGLGNDTVTVYAENRVNAERTCRSLHLLACGIFEACFYFNTDNAIYGVNFLNIVSQLSQTSGADISYDPTHIQIFGPEYAVRHVLHELSFLKVFHSSTVLNIELSLDQQEFISGKKSGKINKIMKTSGARIKFVPFNEYNFIIELESNQFNKALEGLSLLQEELPAEISFYVPEKYHKRIIGVGGKNIQRIMKKYGVYVKFSNTEEFASLGGYYDNEDNVVARTPMKNRVNLENLRHAVIDLINPKDRDNIEHVLYDIPFWIRRSSFAHELKEVTKRTNTHLSWPDDELANDTVTLVGPESQVLIAAEMIKSALPEEYHIHIPYSPHLKLVLESEAFKRLVQHIHDDFNVLVEPKNTKRDNEIVALKTTKANIDNLTSSLDVLIRFLNNQQISMYDESSTRQTSSFSVFDTTKVVGPSADFIPPTPSSSSSSLFAAPVLKSYSLFDYNPTSNYSRGTSMNDTNIRAIFDTSPPPAIPLVSPISFRQSDIWSNPPQPFGTKQQDFYQSKTEVDPTSSTSTGSNNSSMHSTQSMDSKLPNHTPSSSKKSLEFPSLFADETVIVQNLLNNMSLNN